MGAFENGDGVITARLGGEGALVRVFGTFAVGAGIASPMYFRISSAEAIGAEVQGLKR